MKSYEILDDDGKKIAELTAAHVSFIEHGIDFQPNIFNGYHAIELGAGDPPAVLNLPEGWSIRKVI